MDSNQMNAKSFLHALSQDDPKIALEIEAKLDDVCRAAYRELLWTRLSTLIKSAWASRSASEDFTPKLFVIVRVASAVTRRDTSKLVEPASSGSVVAILRPRQSAQSAGPVQTTGLVYLDTSNAKERSTRKLPTQPHDEEHGCFLECDSLGICYLYGLDAPDGIVTAQPHLDRDSAGKTSAVEEVSYTLRRVPDEARPHEAGIPCHCVEGVLGESGARKLCEGVLVFQATTARIPDAAAPESLVRAEVKGVPSAEVDRPTCSVTEGKSFPGPKVPKGASASF